MPVDRTFMAGWIDDDGSGTTGEILEVGDFSVFVDAIDEALVAGGGGTPGGSDTQVQFNDGGAFAGDSGLTFNKATDTLVVGSTVDITGGKIQFPAVQVPAAGGNVLDDYEEGTWTPTIVGATGTAGGYTAQNGHYIKIGQLVTMWFDVQLSSKGTLSGNIFIGGFPFPTHASHPQVPADVFWSATATAFAKVSLNLVPGVSQAVLFYIAVPATSAGANVIQAADLAATTLFRGAIVYRANA